MKHLISALCSVIIAVLPAIAQVSDTVVVIKKPHRIVITERGDSGMCLEVAGAGNNKDFHYRYSTEYDNTMPDSIDDDFNIPFFSTISAKKHSKISVDWFTSLGMHYGFVNMSGAGDISDMASSAEIGVLNPISMAVVFPHRWRITTGLGFGWKGYRLNSSSRFVIDDAGLMTLAPYDNNSYDRLSRLKIFYLDIPIMVKKTMGDFSVCAGGVVNFNVYGSVLTRYRIDNALYKTCSQGINQQKVTIDFMAVVQLYDIGIYLKYSPCNVLKKGNLPEFRSMSIGFGIGF